MNKFNQLPVKPSDIVGLITRQHHAAAERFTELERLAETLPTTEMAGVEPATTLTLTLCDELMDHIVVEGRILVPALREVDAWGTHRADHLIGRLRRRRREIEALRGACVSADGTGTDLRDVVGRFIDNQRAAMASATRRDLKILRDDVTSVDCGGS